MFKAILADRENRVRRQAALLARWGAALLCFTVNMPGPRKAGPEAGAVFRAGLEAVRGLLDDAGWESPGRREQYAATGFEALIGVEAAPVELKKALVGVEEAHPLGRLFDFDVLGADGRAVSRAVLGLPSRACFLCLRPAAECARSRRHNQDALLAWIRRKTELFQQNARTGPDLKDRRFRRG